MQLGHVMDRCNILAHRGLWSSKEEQNSRSAIKRALASGFGIETDIRDHDGRVVLSHDVPRNDDYELVSYSELLEMLEGADERSHCALNVKSDGLLNIIQGEPRGTRDTSRQLFYFDMSIPETVQYMKHSVGLFARVSEFETIVFPPSQVKGIWLDAFGSEFDQASEARKLLNQGYTVAMVSPELHGRSHTAAWNDIIRWGLHLEPNFMICTDHPFEAAKVFDHEGIAN